MYILRPPPAGGGSHRLRAVPRGQTWPRPPALCRTPGCRPMRTLQAAHGRRPVALRPVPRAGEGARLSRASQRRRQETLCREARAERVCGLWSPHRWLGPLSALRISFQLPRARASPGGALAAADYRGRVADLAGAGDLRDGGRGGRLPRLRQAAARPSRILLQRAADGAAAGMSAERAQASRSGRTCGPAPGERLRSGAIADRSTHRAARRFIVAGRWYSADSGRANTPRSSARRSRSGVPEARSTPGLIVAGRRRCQSRSTRTVRMRGKGGQL